MSETKTESFSFPCYSFCTVFAMEKLLAGWKNDIEHIWSAHAADYGEAVRVAMRIAAAAEEEILRQAASQALPIFRAAAHADVADHTIRDAARRRLAILRDVLLALTTPKFGKRQNAVTLPTREESCRQLLGLPLGRRLSETEIHSAYKRLAKQAHPDAGGNVRAFLELSAARDALMQERRMGPRS
jgi:hypothetical protein